MERPKIEDFLKAVMCDGRAIATAIDFTAYAFALEKYATYLEQKIKLVEK